MLMVLVVGGIAVNGCVLLNVPSGRMTEDHSVYGYSKGDEDRSDPDLSVYAPPRRESSSEDFPNNKGRK